MATVTFTKGATVKTIRVNKKPLVNPWKPRQRMGVSVGGQVKVSKRGVADQFLRLDFTRLNPTEQADLEGFIQNTVDGHMETFDFTDWEGTVHTPVRFWEIGDFSMPINDLWDFNCVLRKEIA